MPAAGRLGDKAQCPSDAHGCPSCPHSVTGPGVGGSPDVNINGRAALRVGDPGIHAACCNGNTWKAAAGSTGVFINSKAAHRLGDQTTHCGGVGKLIEGSGNVFIGDKSGSGSSSSPPPETKKQYIVSFVLNDPFGNPRAEADVKVFFETGEVRSLKLDKNGAGIIKNAPEGKYFVKVIKVKHGKS